MKDTDQTVASQVARLEADLANCKALLVIAQADIDHLKRKCQLMRDLIAEFEKEA